MKSLKLIGLAFGASLALSASALAQDITVGVAGPMTGGESAFGRQMKNGAEQAVEDLNAAGGVLGKKLALQVGDDACDPKQARSIAEKFASSKVPFVAGHYCSSSSIPASEAYAEGNVLQITPASTNPLYHRAQALERGARLRPRRSAGPGRRRVHPEELQGQERRHPQRQVHLRQGSGRRDQEGAEQGRLHREDVRILQQGRQGF